MQKIFIMIGIVLILIGFAWPYLQRTGLGRLPGDIFIKRDSFSFYFPLTTCLIISVILTLLFWFFRK